MELKVISFNIRYADDPDGHSRAERAPRLCRVISDAAPDLIGFQEFTPAWEGILKPYFESDYEFFIRYRNREDAESSTILWRRDRFECLKKGYFWLSDTPDEESRGWDKLCDCYRICAYAVLKEKASGKAFTFMNTHFGFGDDCQCASVGLIDRRRRAISDLPTFITGDFNMPPESPAYAKMISCMTDVNAVTARDLRTTYHGYHPETMTGDRCEHIDYCFVSSGVTPLSQRIMDERFDGRFPSDHFGLEIGLEI